MKVVVLWLTPDEDANDFFRQMRETLITKYGPPDFDHEIYESPYEKGDGYRDTAIRLGKARIAAIWNWPGRPSAEPSGLSLTVTKALAVSSHYEPPEWIAASRRRAVHQARDY